MTTFIKDLQWADKLSERFRDALEEFLPKWLEDMMIYYKEGKERGIDIFCLNNFIPTNTPSEEVIFEHNGIAYYQHHWPDSPVTTLGFNDKKGYRLCNWMECLIHDYLPNYNTASKENRDNHWQYNWYMNRLYNLEPKYDIVAKRCNEYFQSLTGDTTSGLSLSRNSCIYYNEKAHNYVNYYYYYD